MWTLYAEGDYSQYYKWEVTETWEYHAAHATEYYYDGTFHKIDPRIIPNNVCWITGLGEECIYSFPQRAFLSNILQTISLALLLTVRSSRLGILYSMMVRQLALSEKAYNYWEQLRINSNEQGGLYEKQPLAIKGNLLDVSHPDKRCTGIFLRRIGVDQKIFLQGY